MKKYICVAISATGVFFQTMKDTVWNLTKKAVLLAKIIYSKIWTYIRICGTTDRAFRCELSLRSS